MVDRLSKDCDYRVRGLEFRDEWMSTSSATKMAEIKRESNRYIYKEFNFKVDVYIEGWQIYITAVIRILKNMISVPLFLFRLLQFFL